MVEQKERAKKNNLIIENRKNVYFCYILRNLIRLSQERTGGAGIGREKIKGLRRPGKTVIDESQLRGGDLDIPHLSDGKSGEFLERERSFTEVTRKRWGQTGGTAVGLPRNRERGGRKGEKRISQGQCH